MIAKHLAPLFFVGALIGCGSGDGAGTPVTEFDDPTPGNYSEQPAAAIETPARGPEQPSPGPEDPRPSAFGLEGDEALGTGAGAAIDPGLEPEPEPTNTTCNANTDACIGCSDQVECLDCWPDAATAETYCSTLFP